MSIRKSIAFLVTMALVFGATATGVLADTAEKQPVVFQKEEGTFSTQNTSYRAYLAKNGAYTEAGLVVETASPAQVLQMDEIGSWTVTVPQSGLYKIGFEYLGASEATNNYNLSVYVDDVQPFEGLSSLSLRRLWQSDPDNTAFVEGGNDIRPTMLEISEWQYYEVRDNEGIEFAPYSFYLEAGEHVISLENLGPGIQVRNLTLNGVNDTQTYEAYLTLHQNAPVYTGAPIEVEAETPLRVNSRNLTASNDMSSPLTTPYDPVYVKLNTFGSSNWRYVGDRAEWEVVVPQAGLYRLSLRFQQNYYNGIETHRCLYVNGRVPFVEAQDLAFGYANGWQSETFGDYYIYLNEGRNTLALEAVLGYNGQLVEKSQSLIYNLNTLYRKIIMVTGTSPDIYRDYALEKEIPGLLDMIAQYQQEVQELINLVKALYGTGGTEMSVLTQLQVQLQDMKEKPASITRSSRLSRFKSNISSLGTWQNKLRDQALELDKITLLGKDENTPPAESTWWDMLVHRAKRFFYSFSTDYSVMGEAEDGGKTLRVWVSSGRDQAQLLKNITDDTFTPETGIHVQVELVSGGLLEAILAGQGPDVALDRSETDPVNYAMRNALYDLKQFGAEFDEVASWLAPASLIPFMYQGGCYGLPITQNFDMLFYRTDILAELGLTVPDTWEDMMATVLPVLQQNNMTIAVGTVTDCNIFKTFLYQYGGQLYTDDLSKAALDTQVAYEAFTDAVDLYTDYSLPQSYDFMNRFRTGEIPMAIATYTVYNNLTYAAPELNGLWEMVEIPGVLQADGTVNRGQILSSSSAIISADTTHPLEAWTFLKWLISAETQARYGNDIESILGAGGRYTPSNIEAMSALPWDAKQVAVLEAQRAACIALPNLPGSYFTTRAIHNAFVSAVIDNQNPRETLLYWNEEINMELERKRQEFGFVPQGLEG